MRVWMNRSRFFYETHRSEIGSEAPKVWDREGNCSLTADIKVLKKHQDQTRDIINPLRNNGIYVYHDCNCNVTFKSLVRSNMLAEELADLHVHIKLFNKESSTPLTKLQRYEQWVKF